jgi:hypothetical protein
LVLNKRTSSTHSFVDEERKSVKMSSSTEPEPTYGILPVGFENLGPEGKQSVKKVVVKLHLKKDETYKTFAITNTTTTSELLAMYAKKIGLKAAESLQLLQVDGKGVERTVDARDRPGGLQLKWQQGEPSSVGKFVVTFSEASKESIRQSVKARRSSTADALEITLGLNKPAAAAAAAASIDDDLAALDAIAADFAVPLSALPASATKTASTTSQPAAAVAKKAAVPQQQQQQQQQQPAPGLNTKTTPGGKTRLKIVPVSEDAEFQGLLDGLKSDRPAAARAPAATAVTAAVADDDFDSLVDSIDGVGGGGGGASGSSASNMLALEEFGIRDDDFNVVVPDSSTPSAKSATTRKKAEDKAFAEIDGALSFALSSLDDMVDTNTSASTASGDGVNIDFDAILASLSKGE